METGNPINVVRHDCKSAPADKGPATDKSFARRLCDKSLRR